MYNRRQSDIEVKGRLLIIRTDADARMGTGHLMRCLALAQAWQNQGGEAIFITACTSDSLRRRLSDEDFQVIALDYVYLEQAEWASTSNVLASHPGAWVVLDGYHFDPSYQLRIKEAGHPLLVIDDMAHLEHYYADIVLNQNIHARQLNYSCEPYTTLLLGTHYALLRREFWPWREWERTIPETARKVLVTLGGGDPDNQTLKVIRALHQVDINGLEATIVIGATNPHFQEIETAIRHSSLPINLVHNTSTMPELMYWAEAAISAGGSTCWEMAFIGLPIMVMVLSENQKGIAAGLAEKKAAINIGWYTEHSIEEIAVKLASLLENRELRCHMSRQGTKLVDGFGSERIEKFLRAQLYSEIARY
jgi:UDP-2,4-diacetamido-2,4,6-trideoxy-beta-L-altropyranose hydrolase